MEARTKIEAGRKSESAFVIYGLCGYYPPVPLLREALVLVVQLNRVLEKIDNEKIDDLIMNIRKLISVGRFHDPQEAILLSYEKVSALYAQVCR